MSIPESSAEPPEPVHHGIASRIRTYFLTGLIVAGPVAITIWLIWSFVTWVDDLVRPFIPVAYRPETYLPVKVPGFGLIIAFLALTVLGFLTANLVGRTFVEIGEMILERMPIVRPIYRGLKQVFETLFSKSGSSFRTVGLVEFPAPGMWSLVFLSHAAGRRVRPRAAERGRIRLGVHAVHAQPDHRLLLLCAAPRRDRARHFGRGCRQAADERRHDPAGRQWRAAEKARRARRDGARRARAVRTPTRGGVS